jgi:hypothetical protein
MIPLRLLSSTGALLLGAATALAAQPPGARLQVIVTDSTGGAPIGATCELTVADTSTRVALVERDGRCRFAPVPAGSHTLRVTLHGFEPHVQDVELDTGSVAELRVELAPAALTEAVIVSATRVPTPVSAVPHTVTIVDRATLEQRTAVSDDLPSVLERHVPGFGPSLKKLTGRGESLRGRNPLYTINGVPQHTPLRDGERDGHTIDLDFVERIEVIHGSNAIQGIGATGGVVNMVTKSPRSDGAWTHDVKL